MPLVLHAEQVDLCGRGGPGGRGWWRAAGCALAFPAAPAAGRLVGPAARPASRLRAARRPAGAAWRARSARPAASGVSAAGGSAGLSAFSPGVGAYAERAGG